MTAFEQAIFPSAPWTEPALDRYAECGGTFPVLLVQRVRTGLVELNEWAACPVVPYVNSGPVSMVHTRGALLAVASRLSVHLNLIMKTGLSPSWPIPAEVSPQGIAGLKREPRSGLQPC